MKSIAVLLVFSLFIALSKSIHLKNNCLRPCPKIYDPVCAYDGENFKTFSSSCSMDLLNCEKETHFTVAQQGECKEDESVAENLDVSSECNKICPLIYAPVCGSDGLTYGNMCDFEIRNCQSNFNLSVLKEGEC
ncbi:U-Kazal-Dg21.2-like [Condylostylus longicornis]|uniref:U-Kazal-Dg21.2-like n=1 Tax=Condylostylus longicornis TaxID=2530218 RepID=UPI00244DB4DE|nr:U-Kazal-Dg21.2-like [Condylostylus longicornis]